MDRYNLHQKQNVEQPKGRPVSAMDAARANDFFESFLNANTLKTILGTYRSICDLLHLKPNGLPLFYPKLKEHLNSWRAKALWKKFDARANNKCYGKAKLCPNTRVLIIGAGPCGLRSAIEAQLLGAKVVVVEKRDRISRNNVLHLWPFVIDDLRLLGAKKFFGKFCAGAIDHISIRQLQCILLKAALLLGVEIHTEVSFEGLVEPNADEKTGWKAEFKPIDHPVNQFEFDVVIGADGKRNTLAGFKRKEFRGKLAIAITANFINKRTEAEARVEEISGVAFIFNQKFFKDLFAETGIDLENIVYYKDDTHYFVMTAKKGSLIDKGVIKQDLQDTAKLLAHENVDRNALMNYAREAAEFSTNYMMLDLEFAVNHYGQPDVAMFDFTSMYQAENASRIIERHGYRLLSILVGDSLLEPFWPTGSGCARGFLSSLDAGWAIRSYGSRSLTPLEVLAERESIYRLLPQTTPENLNRDYKSYTLDPSTRYPNLNKNLLLPQQALSLFDTDDVNSIELNRTPMGVLVPSNVVENPNKRRRRDSHVDPDTLLCWVRDQVKEHGDLDVANITTAFKDGRILSAIISHYRPDLLDYSAVTIDDALSNNMVAFNLLEKDLGIPPMMTAEEMVAADVPDFRTMVAYLTQIYDTFRGEIPHIKHPKLRAFSTTRKCLVPPRPVASVLKISKNAERSKFSIVDRSNHVVELFRANHLTASTDFLSISSLGDQNSKSMVLKMNESNVLIVESHELGCKANAVGFNDLARPLDATKLAFIAESIKLQSKIDKALNKSKKRKAHKKDIDVLTTDASTDALSVAPSLTKCIQTEKHADDQQPLVVKVNERGRSNTENLNIIIKDNQAVHCLNYDSRANCLYIMLPDFMQKMRSNPINNRQLDVLNSVHVCKHHDFLTVNKFLSIKMNRADQSNDTGQPPYNFDRVVNWISASNFNQALTGTGTETPKTTSVVQNLDGLTDITSVTRQKPIPPKDSIGQANTPVRNEGVDHVKAKTPGSNDTIEGLTKMLEDLKTKNIEQKGKRTEPAQKLMDKSANRQDPNGMFSVIVESDESELPESRRHQDLLKQTAFTKNHPAIKPAIAQFAANSSAPPTTTGHHRPATRHRRHAELPEPSPNTAPNHDRKPRKRRSTIEKVEKFTVGSVEERMMRLEEIASNRNERQSKRRQQRRMQTEQFIKSMQMLQANSISEGSEPFEDYSIFLYRQTAPNFEDRVKDLEKKFTYIPDRENRAPPVQQRGEKDEDFLARIKGMEDKSLDNFVADKKPKGLLRAIGKIDNTDWNIKEIEKKIIENKLGKSVNKDKEKVPKWSKEQFQARQLKMEKQHLERQDSAGDKYAEIDKSIKHLDQRLKEGTVRELHRKKVAQITEKLKPKAEEPKPTQKNVSKPAVVLPNQGKSETCHFCSKRVYLMERLSAEGKFFHRGCFRCQYCHTALRLGSYMYDRDGKYGYRFYCAQHFGMPGEIKQTKIVRKSTQKNPEKSPEKKFLTGVAGVDLLDRDVLAGQTPERIEFDLSAGQASSDHEEPLSQMDEDEWTDRNFGASTAELGSSDDDESSFSESEDDDDDAFEEALEEPPTKEGTLKLFNTLCKKRFSRHRNESDSDSYSSSDRSSYYENSSGDDDSDTATEGEEEIQARERRKMEVQVKPPIVHTDTGTDTEIASDDETSSSSEVQNSATEISTDSEFAHDDPTPTCEIPSIVLNDKFVTKTRGSSKLSPPQKVQVKSAEIQKPVVNTASKTPANRGKDIELKFTPLVQTPIRKPVAPLLLRTEGYALNRTQSTGGIATKVSLELKKKYLLGENNPSTAIQKSGSASTLDSKFKSFHSNISDCQKLLKPSAEISASMQTFCNKLDEHRTSPISPLATSRPIFKLPETKPVEIKKSGILSSSTPSAITKTTKNDIIEEHPEVPVVPNESEGRPRSPVHETSIIVPQIDWSQHSKEKPSSSEGTSDTTTSSTDSDENQIQKSPSVKAFNVTQETAPNVNIRENNNDNIPMDSLNYISYSKMESQPSSINDPPKSISSEKKVLNQPKTLPKLDDDLLLAQVHSVLHKPKPVIVESVSKPEENTEKIISGRSTPSHESGVYQVTAALTETELSDWAHDGMVSDDFAESDYEVKELENTMDKPAVARKATIVEAENVNVLKSLPKEPEEEKFECISNILCPTLDNIEFMDTGSESSEDEEVAPAKNNGYIQFHDEDDIAEDSLSPVINIVVEAKNPIVKATIDEDFDALSTVEKNTGYCFIADGNHDSYGGEVVDLKPIDLQLLKEKQNLFDNEEDSLIIIEKSTTDDNTCSDSTVKNVTEMAPKEQLPPPPPVPVVVENNNILDKKRLEDKLAQVKSEMKLISDQRKAARIEDQNQRNSEFVQFEQHCQRLQSKVDFGNAKDSIDIRKARRQSKSGSPPKPDLIQEEKEVTSPIRSRREQIEMERDWNKKLVQEMVMNKMRAENKSLERKRRNRNFSPNLSPSRPYELTKSPTDMATRIRHPTPDVLLSTINSPLQKSETLSDFQSDRVAIRPKYAPLSSNNSRPLSAFVAGKSDHLKLSEKSLSNSEAFSLPDIQKAIDGDFTTPKAPPRTKNEGNRIVDKLKEDARARARLLSDEDLGLSPEEKLAQLRIRLARRGKENDNIHMQGNVQPTFAMNIERPSTLFYKNDTLNKKKIASFRRSKSGDDHLNLKVNSQPTRERTKSFGESQVKLSLRSSDGAEGKGFKSDPNLLLDSVEVNKKKEKKSKDRERRKSITKMITDLFAKKKDFNVTSTNNNKGFLSRISPKTKDKSKEVVKEEPVRRMSYTETRRFTPGNVSPPPIPPLPLNYTGAKSIDDSSDGEGDWKRNDRSSCDTLDQSGLQEGSISSRRSSSRSARKARQSQSKRHRMAQEIQRKLEETDVKTRELELRGVKIEKALRGECDSPNQDEAALLKEWFDLMKDITELRRYERELMVRAQELELEDRHARLQHDLKERLSNELKKSEKDIETESSIIQEMLDIVAKRDSLIVLLEEERLRYKDEDRTLEEQMRAKGINVAAAMTSATASK